MKHACFLTNAVLHCTHAVAKMPSDDEGSLVAESVHTLAARQLTIDDSNSRMQIKELNKKLSTLRRMTFAGITVLVAAIAFLAYHTETRLELEGQRFRHQLERYHLSASPQVATSARPKMTTTSREVVKRSDFERLEKKVEGITKDSNETRKKAELCAQEVTHMSEKCNSILDVLPHKVAKLDFQQLKDVILHKVGKITTDINEIKAHIDQNNEVSREKFTYWSELTLEINHAVRDLEETAAEASKNSTLTEKRFKNLPCSVLT